MFLQDLKLSVLGEILFENAKRPEKRNKKFKILIWRFGQALERRHLKYFQSEK